MATSSNTRFLILAIRSRTNIPGEDRVDGALTVAHTSLYIVLVAGDHGIC